MEIYLLLRIVNLAEIKHKSIASYNYNTSVILQRKQMKSGEVAWGKAGDQSINFVTSFIS